VADVTVYATNSEASAKYGLRGPVWTSSSVCYVFFTDGHNFYYKKSTDGGATFGSAVTIGLDSDTWVLSPAIWFDKWTPGDTGTKIHIAYHREVGGDDQVYRSLDTASDTLSSEVTISSLAYADFSQVTTGFSITKARGGNLYVAMFGGDIADSFYRSTDGGANWTSRNAGYWESDNDDTPYCILMPGNESDNQDIYMVFGDQSADEVSVKHYDDSANTWPTELSIATSVTIGWVGYFVQQVAVSIRHSDNHLIIAAATAVDNAAADLIVYDVTDISTKTAKTNIITNQDDWSGPTVLIDQNTDDIYVAWLGKGDGTGTFGTSIDIYYAVSTDGGSTWGTATKYNTTAGDYRWIAAGVSTPGAAAGRFAPTFWSNATDDLFINSGNSVSISGGGGVTTRRYSLSLTGVG
jgi:hypothetical protein